MAIKMRCPDGYVVNVDTEWGTVHIYDSVDGLIVDLYQPGYLRPVWSAAWDEEDLRELRAQARKRINRSVACGKEDSNG